MIKPEVEKILLKVQKPARYIGSEINAVKKDLKDIDVRFAFCFPDTYEIGMSHLGMKILYSLLNEMEGVYCERVFMPWVDMVKEMEENSIPLFALETADNVRDFDILGFTLQYELSYSNMIKMLMLAGIPPLQKDRQGLSNIVCVGGPCAYNCEPLCDFIDFAILGEGEEVMGEVIEAFKEAKEKNMSRLDFLRAVAKIKGVYVPSFYKVNYNYDGTVKEIKNNEWTPEKVTKRIIADIDTVFFPSKFVVPNIETVHDRIMVELFRGCIRGCRFCQAGMIYRLVREKSPERLLKEAIELEESSGYEEIALTSLSSSDYTHIHELAGNLCEFASKLSINLSLPSLRIDNFDAELLQKVQSVRKTSITFAPEAGSQRLRDVINKNITYEDIMDTVNTAFAGGQSAIKLYFMIGLPTETEEDLLAIADLCTDIIGLYYKEYKGCIKPPNITVSSATFVPKPFTPFQWEGQDTIDEIHEKQAFLRSAIKQRNIRLNWHDAKTSRLEAVFARGDRRLANVLLRAVEKGCMFDGWDDQFRYDLWEEAFFECGLDMDFYASRERGETEILPWDHIDVGVTKRFLLRERGKAYRAETTAHCREICSNCGVTELKGGKCFE